jgi:putative methionine-R-sulfoxide reductase with GAF domain
MKKKKIHQKKERLREINQIEYSRIKSELRVLSQNWNEEEQLKSEQILNLSDNYFLLIEELMRNLNSPEKYEEVDFEERYAISVQDGTPMMDLAENIQIQTEEMFITKRNELLSYNSSMETSFNSFLNTLVITGILLISVILIIAFVLINSLLIPINKIKSSIRSLATGEFPKQKIQTSTDEIGETIVVLDKLTDGLREKANFAKDIEKGNFNSYFTTGGKNDLLGNSLLAMRDSLAKAVEEEKVRRKENEERNWSTQGISEFNVLIRDHSGNPEDFALVTINKLTRYTESQVGGFYMLNEKNKDDIFLELIAFYAYDRHKFFEMQIPPGQGLVGQAYLEKDTIFISDVPETYIKISSGLGKKSPKSILIVPLIVNEKVYGVVELASFEVFEKYKIEFVEKVGEILASTIATIQINQQTAQILEESREKSEILEHQEKESMKNIEMLNTELEIAQKTIEQLKNKIAESEKNADNESDDTDAEKDEKE